MIKYITSRPLWFNILVAIGLVFIVILIFILLLGLITRHGQSKTVPYVVGKNIRDVEKQLSDAGFETIIQDSVFYDSVPRGIVVKQIPDADAVVKVNRNVYVIINRFVAPDVPMPNIIGYTLRNAEYTLEGMGLKLGDTTSVTDFTKNTVKQMLYNGQPIKAGDKIKVGSKIDLVITRGPGEEEISIPNLIGLTLGEAKIILQDKGLDLYVYPPELANNDNVYIYQQDPTAHSGRIRPGQIIDLKVQTEKPVVDSSQNHIPQTPQLPK